MIGQLRVVLRGPGPALTTSPVLRGKIMLAVRECRLPDLTQTMTILIIQHWAQEVKNRGVAPALVSLEMVILRLNPMLQC